jgi:hypothetical protein
LSKFHIHLISFCLIASSFAHAATKNEIDDLMYKAFGLILKKEFSGSKAAYSDLLKYKSDMNLSQLANTYKSLLELSYILDNKEDAKHFGKKLILLIKNEPDYVQTYERLTYRICSSQDWAKFQYIFKEHCG